MVNYSTENVKLKIKHIKKMPLFTIYFLLFIFISGCAVKTTPVYAVIRTPKIKLADQGFIKKGFGWKKIIIYKDANVPIEITVKNSQICMNGRCMDKERFIKRFLPKGYPNDFFDKILNKKCPKGYFCKTDKNKILFKDRKHGILIFIKDLK